VHSDRPVERSTPFGPEDRRAAPAPAAAPGRTDEAAAADIVRITLKPSTLLCLPDTVIDPRDRPGEK
jgi:hypothetical protein